MALWIWVRESQDALGRVASPVICHLLVGRVAQPKWTEPAGCPSWRHPLELFTRQGWGEGFQEPLPCAQPVEPETPPASRSLP